MINSDFTKGEYVIPVAINLSDFYPYNKLIPNWGCHRHLL